MDNTIHGYNGSLSPASFKRPPSKDELRLKKACQGFESMFIQEMLKSMRKTIPESGLLEGGVRQKIYESMYDEAVSNALSERSALGIADMLYKELAPYATGGGE